MEGFVAELVLLLAACGFVSGIQIYTTSEMIVENGTNIRLSCTFKSTSIIGASTSVSWSFTPEASETAVRFFQYSGGKFFVAPESRFKDRVTWHGNINKKDGSINIADINFKDNGTFACDVSNPPDIGGTTGKIRLSVVEKGSLPYNMTGIIVGAVIAGIIIIVLIGIVVYCVKKKKGDKRNGYMGSIEIVSPTEEPLKMSADTFESDSVTRVSVGPRQGPIIYAELDHSGGKQSKKIYKSERVVYADIQKS
ncbi:myelin protein zero-like protein 1 isoform X1 [Callorhinchus milii]|uniref:Myelin protein zero-like 1 n=1 Tax=Callorhinchus milii TaxID=7868 RepID=V9L6L7_CALMI|nr:myelin protein zero-like protein 1 isoform X1 [Callorhinchus milii]|eukprot:gi/632956537/ref/XP_007894005.1/ PREDICTED: myelin protein zero-like protein 1 isoform X1 [Callorhinchus milii]